MEDSNRSAVSLPILNGNNYDSWSIKMRTYLNSQTLWEIVNVGFSKDIDTHMISKPKRDEFETLQQKDFLALYAIQQAVTEEIFSEIKSAKNSKKAWGKLKKMYERPHKVHETSSWPKEIENRKKEKIDYDAMEKKLKSRKSALHSEKLIYRVPPVFRDGNDSAFEPVVISIGPYHSDKDTLQGHKKRYLGHLLSRNPGASFKELAERLTEVETRARSYYAEKINLSTADFVEMLCLDGSFIVELFLKWALKEDGDHHHEHKGNQANEDDLQDDHEEMEGGHEENSAGAEENRGKERREYKDELLKGPAWLPKYIHRDLLLIENQLPFFVLEKIVECIKPLEENTKCLADYSIKFFNSYAPWKTEKIEARRLKRIFHLLHLFHTDLFPSNYQRQSNNDKPQKEPKCNEFASTYDLPLYFCSPFTTRPHNSASKHGNKGQEPKPSCCGCSFTSKDSAEFPLSMPSAKALTEARVKFRRKEKRMETERFFLQIAFEHGEMSIPHFLIDDNSESLFRNFLAYEQFSLKTTTDRHHFTDCLKLMDCLLNSEKDVEILRKNRILEHGLGSDEDVVKLFNDANRGIAVDLRYQYLADIFARVDKHCSKSHNVWIAELVHKYFQNPWTIFALSGAIFALTLSFLSTVLAVISFAKGR